MNFVINTDGASRGNPGPASYGFVIKNKEGVILHQEGVTIGVATNNIAEYTAVLKALEYVEKRYGGRTPHTVEIVADSELIIRQLSGKYKVKNPNLSLIYFEIKNLEEKIGVIKYRNVPREQNFIADRLANIALDKDLK